MRKPRVSIGMPVYNGEEYLADAIESIRRQTFTDLEIVLADNASSDGTADLCQSLATRDGRIRYIRNPKNIGAGPNHRLVAELARGEYFKWHSRDDLCHPSFVERCVAVLDRDPSVVLCHSLTRLIDEDGSVIEDYRRRLQTEAERADIRFRELIWYDHKCYQVYGVMRTAAMRRAGGMPCCVGGDGILLAHLALLGKLHEIPEYLFYSRQHNAQSGRTLPEHFHTGRKRLFPNTVGNLPPLDWWDPTMKGKVALPEATLFGHYLRAVMKARPLRWSEIALSLLWLGPWAVKHAPRLIDDLKMATDIIVAPLLNGANRRPSSVQEGE